MAEWALDAHHRSVASKAPGRVNELISGPDLPLRFQGDWLEARRCEAAEANLAGCVMLGSAVGCLLLLFWDIFFEEALEALATEKAPRNRNGKSKHLLEWSLADFLRVRGLRTGFQRPLRIRKPPSAIALLR